MNMPQAKGGWPVSGDRWAPERHSQAGRIDSTEAMLALEECDMGFPFAYMQDAEPEVSRFFKQTGRQIRLLTVRQILDDQLTHAMG
jgi:hypothetical protein